MLTEKRRYNLEIWALGLGFYLFYTPYSGLTKALSNGLFTGTHGPVKGTVLLPVSAIATVVGMLGFITVMGWWKYAGRREFFGLSDSVPATADFSLRSVHGDDHGHHHARVYFWRTLDRAGAGIAARRHTDHRADRGFHRWASRALVFMDSDDCQSGSSAGRAERCIELHAHNRRDYRCGGLPRGLFFQIAVYEPAGEVG